MYVAKKQTSHVVIIGRVGTVCQTILPCATQSVTKRYPFSITKSIITKRYTNYHYQALQIMHYNIAEINYT